MINIINNINNTIGSTCMTSKTNTFSISKLALLAQVPSFHVNTCNRIITTIIISIISGIRKIEVAIGNLIFEKKSFSGFVLFSFWVN